MTVRRHFRKFRVVNYTTDNGTYQIQPEESGTLFHNKGASNSTTNFYVFPIDPPLGTFYGFWAANGTCKLQLFTGGYSGSILGPDRFKMTNGLFHSIQYSGLANDVGRDTNAQFWYIYIGDNKWYEYGTNSAFIYGVSSASIPEHQTVTRNIQFSVYGPDFNRAVNKTSNYEILASETGTVFNNTGAGGDVNFTLPSAQAGLYFMFLGNTGSNCIITANTDDYIQRYDATPGNENDTVLDQSGTHNLIELLAIDDDDWLPLSGYLFNGWT